MYIIDKQSDKMHRNDQKHSNLENRYETVADVPESWVLNKYE